MSVVDYSTPVGKVRSLIPDVELLQDPMDPTGDPDFLFSNEHLEALLAIAGGRVRRAAAEALEVLGTSEGLISKVITTADLKTDGAKLMQQFLARAKQMREIDWREEQEDDESGSLEIVPDTTFVLGLRGYDYPEFPYLGTQESLT